MSPEALLSQIDLLTDTNKRLENDVTMLRDENVFLKERIDWFERQIFGQKRERFVPVNGQTELAFGLSQQAPVVTEQVINYTRTTVSKPPTPHGREELPAHLPRVKEYVKPDYDTTGMEKISEKITETLEYKPPVFFVKQLIREVHVQKADDNGTERTVMCSELPPRCIEKGKAGASVVAQAIVTKCVDHNPLYRFQDQIKRNCGLDIPYSTLSGWFMKGLFWLEPLAKRQHEILLTSGYIQTDETTIRVMIKPTEGKSHQGYMHLCLSPELPAVSFHYFNTRNQQHVQELLGPRYRGIVQSDGLKIYDVLNSTEGIEHGGCGAHARRGFMEAEGSDRKRAHQILDKWKELFAIEALARDQAMDANQRLAQRIEKSQPIMNDIKTWLNENISQVTPASLIGKAIAYMLNRWDELTLFLRNGRIELSTNLIENRVRPFVLGRKNFLFCQSEESAQALAAAYTIMGTCKLLGINQFDYLCDVLDKIPDRKANDIDDLLPANWKLSRK